MIADDDDGFMTAKDDDDFDYAGAMEKDDDESIKYEASERTRRRVCKR